jgi:hypothetical protein
MTFQQNGRRPQSPNARDNLKPATRKERSAPLEPSHEPNAIGIAWLRDDMSLLKPSTRLSERQPNTNCARPSRFPEQSSMFSAVCSRWKQRGGGEMMQHHHACAHHRQGIHITADTARALPIRILLLLVHRMQTYAPQVRHQQSSKVT